MATQGSKRAVVVAILGNALVMVAKFVAFLFTGSGAMLSEAIHTLADLINQILLLIGIVRSDRVPDLEFQYGYRSERYVWALISAVGIFFLGCGVTIYHGVQSLIHPHELQDLSWAIGVLIFALLLEGYVLLVAVRAVQKQAAGKPFFRYIRQEADPATVAVVLEDSAACFGCVIAMVAILMAKWTGSPYWDALGSIVIGCLLGVIAVWLIWRNSQLLIGLSVPPKIRRQISRIIEQNPAVEEIVDMKTRVLDTETYRIKADVRFDGESLAKQLGEKIDQAYEEIESREQFHQFAREYADDVVELLADEIDNIERNIQAEFPKARHLDIEAD
ncbi:MAG: cation diffusion facilitator family transporter [Mariniblastus sp.]|nr:cation diffusion facilitator family transporter [Mariniblastus sp.]